MWVCMERSLLDDFSDVICVPVVRNWDSNEKNLKTIFSWHKIKLILRNFCVCLFQWDGCRGRDFAVLLIARRILKTALGKTRATHDVLNKWIETIEHDSLRSLLAMRHNSYLQKPKLDWLIDWLIDCFIDWLIDRFIDWLIDLTAVKDFTWKWQMQCTLVVTAMLAINISALM